MENKNKIIVIALIIIIVALLIGVVATMPNAAKKDTKLKFKSNSTITEGDSIKFKLTDDNGTALKNQTVNITITSKDKTSDYHSVVTNKNGVGSFKIDKKPGKYNVTITYAGNDNYTVCNVTKKITIKEEVVESVPEQTVSSTSQSSDDDNYYNGYSRSDFSPGQQAAIDEALANGYSSPAEYYQATGRQAGQAYMDAHPEEAGLRA